MWLSYLIYLAQILSQDENKIDIKDSKIDINIDKLNIDGLNNNVGSFLTLPQEFGMRTVIVREPDEPNNIAPSLLNLLN